MADDESHDEYFLPILQDSIPTLQPALNVTTKMIEYLEEQKDLMRAKEEELKEKDKLDAAADVGMIIKFLNEIIDRITKIAEKLSWFIQSVTTAPKQRGHNAQKRVKALNDALWYARTMEISIDNLAPYVHKYIPLVWDRDLHDIDYAIRQARSSILFCIGEYNCGEQAFLGYNPKLFPLHLTLYRKLCQHNPELLSQFKSCQTAFQHLLNQGILH